jgi:hypothetical protein
MQKILISQLFIWMWHLVIQSKKIRQFAGVLEQVARKICAPRNTRFTGQKKTLWTEKFKHKRPSTYERNIEAHLCNQRCCWTAISTSYSECVSAPLDIKHAECMHRIAICGLYVSTIPFHIISHTAWFSKEKKKLLCIKNVCFDFLYNFVWNISHSKNNWGR